VPPAAAIHIPAESADQLAAGLAAIGERASAGDLARLNAYAEMLMRWNHAHGLTAAASRDDLIARHLLDSAAALPFLPPGPLLDAGSGGGLPGLVLALLRPDMNWALLDSAARKVAFLRHASAELGLRNVRVVRARLEEYDPREAPAALIARALAPLPKLVALSRRLLRRGSLLVAMLGRRPGNDELAALSEVRCQALEPVRVPGLSARRHIAIFRHDPSHRSGGKAQA